MATVTQNPPISRVSLLVLSAVSALDENAFGLNIRDFIETGFHTKLNLDEVYDVLIDLIQERRLITENVPFSNFAAFRKRFKLILPENMVPYGPTHHLYPQEPIDWNEGPVYTLDGNLHTPPSNRSMFSWKHDPKVSGSDIIGYYSMFE